MAILMQGNLLYLNNITLYIIYFIFYNIKLFYIYFIYRALEVINRIQAKLTGRDFISAGISFSASLDEELNVEQQVAKLISEATSVENQCQLFVGWCAYW